MSAPQTFWSRRRAAVEAEEQALLAEKAQAEAETACAEKTDAEILEELKLPDPDELQAGDDFSAFMAKAVPQHIRSRALRKLWRSNPVLACLDGLNDYDDDYLTLGQSNGPIRTTYQVGKGMLAHLLEMERQAEQAEHLDEDVQPVPADHVEEPAAVALAETTTEPDDPGEIMYDDAPAAPPRRMQFRFEGEQA